METDSSVSVVYDASFKIDPMLPYRQLTSFAALVDKPNHVAIIENFREHMLQEMIELDIDRLMNTMVAQPELHFYGLGAPSDIGYDAVRDHYLKSFPSRALGGVTMDVHRLLVDDDALYLDGSGLFSLDFTKEHFGVTIETDRPAIITKHVAVLCPYTDGKIRYEAQYYGGAVTAADLVYLDD